MRRYPCIPAVIALVLAMAGCATQSDVRRVHSNLDNQIRLTNEKITAVEQQLTSGVREEIAVLRSQDEKNAQSIAALRGTLAESRAEVTEIREQIQQIKGGIDSLRRDLSTTATRTARQREDEDRVIRDRLDKLTFKVNFIENFLGIGKKDEMPEPAAEKNGRPSAAPKEAATVGKTPTAKEAAPAAKARPTDKESLYAAAYDLFREGKYEKSREAFESFLKQYPETEFSDNAQFWIGECYYFEKKYEKAIIEYDKVVKNFPEGSKVPYALLKQGLSFLQLGDKASAKLLLQQVIKDYPNTSQARIARTRLAEIK